MNNFKIKKTMCHPYLKVWFCFRHLFFGCKKILSEEFSAQKMQRIFLCSEIKKNYRSHPKRFGLISDSNKRGEPQLVTVILLIFLILTAVALIWRVVFLFVDQGRTEISYKSDCLKINLEIVKVNNNFEDNLILRRGTGDGRLSGVRVFLNNQNIEDLQLKIDEVEEKAFTIQNPLLRTNPNAVGKYVKIAKLVGKDFNNSNICELDDQSAEGGVMIIKS